MHEFFPLFIHTCCLGCDGCEAAESLRRWLAMPGPSRARSFSAGPVRNGSSQAATCRVARVTISINVSTLGQHSPTRSCWQANPFSLSLPTYREGREFLLLCETLFVPEPDIGSLGSHTRFDVCVGDLASPETQMEGRSH
jgi:hypothetical protein